MHLVLIGAGPHGLAVLSALAERGSWPERVTVVDPHDRWCSAWDGKLERLNLDRLRSPQVHHPGVHPMALRDMVEALADPAAQAALRRPEAERVPTPAGMRQFIDQLAAGLGPIRWLQGRATAVTAAAGDGATVQVQPLDAAGSGQSDPISLQADAVVAAHNPSFLRLPPWAEPLVARGAAEHAATVDVRTADIAGREVLIVGGGLTAACLALEAVRRGARATVFTRRPLRARPYDVDASWIGPRHLTPYLHASVAERRALIDVARDGGTIPPRTLEQLRRAADDPNVPLELREAVEVEAAVREALGRRETAPLLWLATGYVQDIRRDPLLGPVAVALGVTVHDGLPEVGEDLRLDDSAIFVTGPYAALGVGPACRNLAGARPAAQRIAAGLLR